MRRLLILLSLLILCNMGLSAQEDYTWWNEIHQWDGITPWNNLITISPGFLGPNALPVPEIQDGSIARNASVETGFDGYYSKGDRTANLFTRLFLPLFSDRAALDLWYIPVEYYVTDTVTRDLRYSREYDGKGTSLGDLYFGTAIQLVQERDKFPGILVTLNARTASGTNFHAARHSNTPGYYFDLSAGKTFQTGEGILEQIRIYGMMGLYVYQTNLSNHMQNDAFLYGVGTNLEFHRWSLKQQLGGYYGYLDNGDRPMVYRALVAVNATKSMDILLRFQQGFVDFAYSSIRVSTLITFNP